MKQHPGHRSSAMRVLIGGVLAVVLGTASSAWACSPLGTFDVLPKLADPESPLERDLVLQFDGNAPAPEDGTIVFAEGNVVEDRTVIITGRRILTAPMTRGQTVVATMTARVTGTGARMGDYFYFSAWAEDANKEVIPNTLRSRTFHLPGPVATPALPPAAGRAFEFGNRPKPSLTKPGLGKPAVTTNPPPADPQGAGNLMVEPAVPGSTPSVLAGAGAGVSSGRRAARIPAGSSSMSNLATDQATGARPDGAVAPDRQGPAGMSPVTASAPLAEAARGRSSLPPEPNELWSGVDPARAPSLLGGTATGGTGGITVGAGLLGLGLVGLAAVAAVTARRRLALVLPSKRG